MNKKPSSFKRSYNFLNVFIGSGIWMLIAMVIAVRQALDYESTWRAIGVVIIGFLVQAIALIVILRIFGVN